MKDIAEFSNYINEGYSCKGRYISLGSAMLNGRVLTGSLVNIPLKTLNRHGLIAGATGTGKTKSLQALCEQLSEQGIPTLVMDVKGDLSGIARPGEEKPFITERMTGIGLPWTPCGYPVELMTLSQQNGVRLRATVSEFGPILLSRILNLSDTQAGVMAVIFKYCDDNNLALLDIKDLKQVLRFMEGEGKEEFEKEYGKTSATTTGTILRKILELEQQGAELFFGELSFEIQDLLRQDANGRAYINIVRVTDIQDRPRLFSTFMLQMLAEIYSTLPEKGDAGIPELVMFIDEAHLIFSQGSRELLQQIETIIKLIRSKGVGIFFVTQNPVDIPAPVLSQLGLKVQHALRAFTAADRKAIKLASENYPLSAYYKTDELITSLGTGEALVTALSEKGVPTPLAAVMMRAPQSRMDILTDDEIAAINRASILVAKYSTVIDRDSAYEILGRRVTMLERARAEEAEFMKQQKQRDQERRSSQQSRTTGQPARKTSTVQRRRTTIHPAVKVLTSATFIRGVFGVLKKFM